MNRIVRLILFLVLVVGGGLAIGFLTAPGAWYAGLAKPSFNPPNWLFAPVWTVLYVLIAMAAWRIFERNRNGWLMKIWWAQLVLNFLWSRCSSQRTRSASHSSSSCYCSPSSSLSLVRPGGRIA